MILNIIFAAIAVLLTIILLDYIKNVYKTEVLLEQLFAKFLRIEATTRYAEKDMYDALGDTLSKAFFTQNSLIYVRGREKFFLKYQSMPHPRWHTLIRKNPAIQEDEAILGRDIHKGILSEGFYTAYFRARPFHTLVLPIKNSHGKTIGIFVFFYFSLVSYLRAIKYLKLNGSKLHDFLKHLLIILREYAMDLKNMTINQIKDYALITTNEHYHITYFNEGALFLLGIQDEARLKNTSFLSYIHNDDLDHFHTIVQNLALTGEVKTHLRLLSGKRDQSQEIFTQAYIKAITLEDEFQGLYILLHDITNEEVMLQQMKRVLAIANSLFTHSDEAIIQVATDGRISRHNHKAQVLCGSEIPLVSQPFHNLFPAPIQEILDTLLDEVKTTGKFHEQQEIEINNQWYHIRAFPVFVDDTYDSCIISFINITTSKEHEKQLAAMNQQMIADLNAARTLQYELLPDSFPHSEVVCYQHLFQPCEEFGGDFYYLEELQLGNKTYHIILVADVAGHGISAAMLAVLVKDVYTTFRNLLASQQQPPIPSRFLDMLNERLCNLNTSTTPFVAAYIGILDIDTLEFSYANGGTPSGIRLHPHHEISFLGLDKSPPPGVEAGFRYTYATTQLHPRDRVIIYTDGIEDLLSFYNTYFNNIIMENRKSSITALKDILSQKIEDFYSLEYYLRYRQDDITIILFEILKKRTNP